MTRALNILAVLVVLGSVAVWLALGANRGWTKTSAQIKTVDEITGIEAITYEDRFQPGLDFVGAGLAVGAALAGMGFLILVTKNKRNKASQAV
jgi:hypothetical protein